METLMIALGCWLAVGLAGGVVFVFFVVGTFSRRSSLEDWADGILITAAMSVFGPGIWIIFFWAAVADWLQNRRLRKSTSNPKHEVRDG